MLLPPGAAAAAGVPVPRASTACCCRAVYCVHSLVMMLLVCEGL
jgi:hypothetical protein